MAQILIRRIDQEAIERLRQRAKRAGRSLEEECRISLVTSARSTGLVQAVEAWRAAWPGGSGDDEPFTDVRQSGRCRDVDLG